MSGDETVGLHRQVFAGPERENIKNSLHIGPQALRRAAVVESLERRAYLAVQVSFGNGIIDNPGPVTPVDFTIGHFNPGSTPDLAAHYHWPGHTDVYEIL